MRSRKLAVVGVAAMLALGWLGSSAPRAAAATGTTTSVTTTAGKGVGSGQWGFVGDIETRSNDTTFSYGIGFNPTDDSLWVTDSGKVAYNAAVCAFVGQPAPCQLGTPRLFRYQNLIGSVTDETAAQSDYLVDGTYSGGAAVADSAGANAGLGKKYDVLADRGLVPFSGALHGPRGVTFTADGTGWIVDSEAVAPYSGDPANPGTPGAIKRFDANLAPLSSVGWTLSNTQFAQRFDAGTHYYRVGAATALDGTVLVNSEVSDLLQRYAADGTPLGPVKLDLPANAGGDPGYRNPYGVAVDPVDGSMYIPLINFRDDPYWQTQPAFLEKRDASGAVIGQIGAGVLPQGQVVMNAAVEPTTQDVFVWSQNNTGASSAVYQFTKDGTYVRDFTAAQFPGLTNVRGLAFDDNGRMFFTVAEGTTNTRVMILGKTPDPVTSVCSFFNAARTEATFTWTAPTATPYQQTPVRDFVIEASTDAGATWAVLPHASASTDTSRTVTGLDPALSYQFRVSAWNEAGNSDWTSVEAIDYVATADAVEVTQGTTATITLTANDTGASVPDGFMLNDPSTGDATASVTIDGQGAFSISDAVVTFVPEPDFVGTASVTYRVMFGDCLLNQTVQVTVVAPSPATLTLVAVGDDPNLWQLTATGAEQFLVGPTGASAELPAGDYVLSESGPTSGYTSSTWSCVDDAGAAVAVIDGQVTLGMGANVTCTISHSKVTTTPTASSTAATQTPSDSESGSVLGTSTTIPGGSGDVAVTGSDIGLGYLAISVGFVAGGTLLATRRRR